MGKKSTPKAPAAPDYAGAATAQGEANMDAARLGAELNNTNQVTPYGSQTFVKDPNSDQWTSTVSLSPEQQNIYDLQVQGDKRLGEMANSQLDRINDTVSQPFDLSGAPDRVSSVDAADYGRYTGSGPQYELYNGTPAASQRVGDAAASQRVGDAAAGQTVGNAAANKQYTGNMPDYSQFAGDIAQTQDYGAQAKEVEDSLYRTATSRLDPQFQQREDQERTRLINSGVPEGSEAFRNAMDAFSRDKNAAYGDARDRAIQGRGAEQSRLNADYLAGNAQRFGQQYSTSDVNNRTKQQTYADALRGLEFNNAAGNTDFANNVTAAGFNNTTTNNDYANRIAGAGFNNAAGNADFANSVTGANTNNAANAQDLQSRLAAMGFNNAASASEFDDQIKALGFNNQQEAQTFLDSIAAGNFQNANRGAAIDEQAYLRNEPLNLYSALASGSQVTQPQFRGTGSVAGPNAAPTFAATQAQDQRAIDLYNAQLASSGSAQGGLMGMLGTLGGQAISTFGSKSDRRLKSNIRKIGRMSVTGLPVYAYSIDGHGQIGVMSDEVRLIYPHAVRRASDGYDRVDYSQLEGKAELA